MTNSVSTNGRPDLSSEPDDRIAAGPIFEGDTDTDKTVVVCGAGGFIGGHLVADVLGQGPHPAL